MFLEKKHVPGPDKYDNGGLPDKVHGFYNPTEVKCSVVGSIAYEKKYIPGPTSYESRGQGMSEILKEKARNFLYHYRPGPKPKSLIKIKKNNDPAPTTYEFGEAREKTSKMRNSIKNTVPKAKNANFLSKSFTYFI